MSDLIHGRVQLFKSLLDFTRTFYQLKTGRPFVVNPPIGRESHYITVMRELEYVLDDKLLDENKQLTRRLLINIPPGHAKSTMLVYFVAWAMAQYPDSQIMYISYSEELAIKHTSSIKEIMQLPAYAELFGVTLRTDSQAKGNFTTTAGGQVKAYGSAGSITGMDAGLPYTPRFSGLVIIDDAHKPNEALSDTQRNKVIENYNLTIMPRPRSDRVPIVMLGQRVHEADLADYFISGQDGYVWRKIILKALDNAGNALCPDVKTAEALRIMSERAAYTFSSQYQQEPTPAGGSIFRPEDFLLLDYEPELLRAFITSDTAETDKTYNDATVFSYWGVYRITHRGVDMGNYGLYLIDTVELFVEPKDLEAKFFEFYADCMRHPKIKPEFVTLEKKSTGVTLISVLNSVPGLRVIDVERTNKMSKAARFLAMQPYISQKLVALHRFGRHTASFIEHMRKITLNDSHRRDDICDTVFDAVDFTFMRGLTLPMDDKQDTITAELAANFAHGQMLRKKSMKGGW